MTNTTCTVVVNTDPDGRCGQPAVQSFTARSGRTYHECAEHAVPGALPQGPHRAVPATRSKAPFLLVRNRDGVIVGYARSNNENVAKRARKLGATVVPNAGVR